MYVKEENKDVFSHLFCVLYNNRCSLQKTYQNAPNIPKTQTLIFLSCRGLVSITPECLFFCQLLSLSYFYLFKRQQQVKPAEPHFLSFLSHLSFLFPGSLQFIHRERERLHLFLCLSKRKPKTLTMELLTGSGQNQPESAGSSSTTLSGGLRFGQKIYFEDGSGAGSSKNRVKSTSRKLMTARCQVEGCRMDLSNAKTYYSRHKVCCIHSKSSKVIVSGLHQRFCQQCSRFLFLPKLLTLYLVLSAF